MRNIRLICCALAIITGAYGLYEYFSPTLLNGYGELMLCTPIMVAWAMWMGKKYSLPGPIYFPLSAQAPFILAIAGVGALVFQVSWFATYLIAPAVLLVLRELKPELATGRILLLFFLAPSSYLLDLYYGESIQLATAASSSAFAQLFNGELGLRTGNELWCDPHKIFVTSACSGARLAVRIVALAVFVASLKRSHPRIIAYLIGIGLVLSVVTNTIRIGVLCLAAPSYAAEDFLGMERYHDISGVVAFFIAYVFLAWANSRLAAVYLDTNDSSQ